MHKHKHSEATKLKISEMKRKNFALKPMDDQWKEKIRESNKATYAALKRSYMIQEYGVKFMEAEFGVEYMIKEYGKDYAKKYANMNHDIKTL
ncbi:hypothetical protein EZS27_023366 [termite gut metagenome]|jgi:hypothetical protein|uniref:Uncharacterized protein n=1 Tax=termite gut metagenome TaxID=433724 RepID=A0A5J4R3W2_9ZZZZ